jgi:hypothetical protein
MKRYDRASEVLVVSFSDSPQVLELALEAGRSSIRPFQAETDGALAMRRNPGCDVNVSMGCGILAAARYRMQ